MKRIQSYKIARIEALDEIWELSFHFVTKISFLNIKNNLFWFVIISKILKYYEIQYWTIYS